jgi:catechol 2,3-dioxygenase-like lactoylglutathione lyase family enzyme
MSHAPQLETIVETSLYADDLAAAEAFYTQVLGLPVLGRDPERHVFFQVGAASVLLVFKPEATLRGDVLPPHGAHGPGHAAFGIASNELEAWRSRLAAHGVATEKEVAWPKGGQSLYFRDPAGNSVELITRGVWGVPAGW